MTESLRAAPRISANKLAEYMLATPRRRKAIIIGQIEKPTAIVIQYNHASQALVRFFRDPARSSRNLLTIAAAMRDRAAVSEYDHPSRCLIASAQALEAFAPVADQFKPRKVLPVASSRNSADLVLSGVRVVVAPEISLIELGSEKRIGAMKFHFPRSTKLSPESLQYLSTLLYSNLLAAGDAPKRLQCIGIDVFSATHETAPRAIADRMKNLEAACEEIAGRWSSLYERLAEKGERRKHEQ